MRDTSKEQIIGFAINILASVVFALLTIYWKILTWKLAIATLILLFVIITTVFLTNSVRAFKKAGIISWAKQRGKSKSFRNILEEAKSSVDFLVSWGGSIPGLSTYWEKDLAEMVNRGINIRILLIKPGSYAEEKRHSDGAQWVRSDIEGTIRKLLSIKNERINSAFRAKFHIGLYSCEAIWAMCFVDNKYASVGFYGEGNGRDHPALELKSVKGLQTFFDAYKNQFEAIWREKKLIHTTDDLERIIAENVKRSGDGIIYALTGPSGAGKTTLSRLLLASIGNTASNVFTYTTRQQRAANESEKQYRFVSKREFDKMEREDEFVVTSVYCGNKYGLRREDVFGVIDSQKDLVLDTIAEPDRLKKVFGNRIVIIYLTASNFVTMRERISERMENNEQEIGQRLQNAKIQSTYATICDYILFTDFNPDDCLTTLLRITKEAKRTYISSGTVSSENLTQYLSSVVIEEGRLPNE